MDIHRSSILNRRIEYAVKVILVIGIPFTAYRSLNDFMQDRDTSAILLLSICLILVLFAIAGFIIKTTAANTLANRVFFFIFVLLVGVELSYLIGLKGELDKIPWFFIFPLVVFNIYGHKKGAILTAILLAVTAVFWQYYLPPLEPMQETLKNRFVQSVLLVGLIYFFAELHRYNQQEELITKHQSLTESEKNLNEINTALKIENRKRKTAEKELTVYKEQLEILVQERTAELARTNEHLIQEIKEREAADARHIQLENQLRQSQKMESLGTFAGGIAHDFNTLLGTIIGYTHIIKKDISEDSPILDNINTITKVAGKAKDLVRQIKAFSHPANEEKKPLGFIATAKSALDLIQKIVPDTIEIQQSLPDREFTVNANESQINQIFINICANAADAIGNNTGYIRIQTEQIDSDELREITPYLRPGNYVKLTIADTGSGIRPDILDRIFDPYFSTKEVGKGSGLGLSVVHGIVSGHNGHIIAESPPGRGTTFSIYLPIQD